MKSNVEPTLPKKSLVSQVELPLFDEFVTKSTKLQSHLKVYIQIFVFIIIITLSFSSTSYFHLFSQFMILKTYNPDRVPSSSSPSQKLLFIHQVIFGMPKHGSFGGSPLSSKVKTRFFSFFGWGGPLSSKVKVTKKASGLATVSLGPSLPPGSKCA